MQERRVYPTKAIQAYQPSREVRPSSSIVLTETKYWELCDGGRDGRRKLAEAFNQAVSEIVKRHQVVEGSLARQLSDWIDGCVHWYFNEKHCEATRVSGDQASERMKRIKSAIQLLLKELPVHYGLRSKSDFDPTGDPDEIRLSFHEQFNQLENILEWANAAYEHNHRVRKEKKNNAAKPMLARLGRKIRHAWLTDFSWSRSEPDPASAARIPPIEAGSKYVQFATYIYAFVGEPCTSERVTIQRLRAAERK